MTPTDREQREAERQQRRAKRRELLITAMIDETVRERLTVYDNDHARQFDAQLAHLHQPILSDAEVARVEAALGRAPQPNPDRRPAKAPPYSVECPRREAFDDGHDERLAPQDRVVTLGTRPRPKPGPPQDFSRETPPEKGRIGPIEIPDTDQ